MGSLITNSLFFDMSIYELKNIALMLKFLSLFHCYPSHNIQVMIDNSSRYQGYYSQGIITLKSDATDRIIVHELYHSCQKTPVDEYEWIENEKQAKHIEYLWSEWLL